MQESILSQQSHPFEATHELFNRLKIVQTGIIHTSDNDNIDIKHDVDDENGQNVKLFARLFASFIPQINDIGLNDSNNNRRVAAKRYIM